MIQKYHKLCTAKFFLRESAVFIVLWMLEQIVYHLQQYFMFVVNSTVSTCNRVGNNGRGPKATYFTKFCSSRNVMLKSWRGVRIQI